MAEVDTDGIELPARELVQRLDFLESGRTYEAQIYADNPGADFRTNPEALSITKRVVTSKDSIALTLAPGEGVAIRFRAVGN